MYGCRAGQSPMFATCIDRRLHVCTESPSAFLFDMQHVPDTVLAHILNHLPLVDFVTCRCVCTHWTQVLDRHWRQRARRDYGVAPWPHVRADVFYRDGALAAHATLISVCSALSLPTLVWLVVE
jgi:hypothetical protein